MANVGTAAAGKTLIGAGNGSSPTYASIGTNSGLTTHGFVIAQGNGPFISLPLTNGQVMIGSNGADPVPASLTAGTGITITPAAGSITISATGTGIQTITGDTGGALSPTAGNFNILSTSTNGIDTAGSGSTLTIGMATPYADGDFEFRSAVSGQTRTLSVTNTVDAASSQAKILTSVAGTSSGDVWSQYTIGSTTSWALGIDNSDSDKLKMTYAAAATATPSDASPFITYDAAGGQVVQLKAQTTTTAYVLNNSTDAQGSQSQYTARGAVSGGDNVVNLVVANTADLVTRVQGRAELQTDEQSLGLNLTGMNSAGTGTLRMYTGNRSAPGLTANCTAAGEWTYPLQPSFRATLSADATNVTGNNTAYTVACNTEAYDRNADYNNATYTFTAPVTGIYHFDSTIFMYGVVAATSVDVTLRNSGGTIIAQLCRTTGLAVSSGGNYAGSWSATIPMTAADTCKLVLTVNGEGSDIIDIQSGTNQTCFSGWLVA